MSAAEHGDRVEKALHGAISSLYASAGWAAHDGGGPASAGLLHTASLQHAQLHSRWHTVMKGGLQPESIGDVVTRAGERAGIEIRFTGHSPRRGLATSSRMKNHDQIVIAKQGGWAPHSKVLAGYLEVVDQWEDNALTGVL